jgi:hypothetical protein
MRRARPFHAQHSGHQSEIPPLGARRPLACRRLLRVGLVVSVATARSTSRSTQRLGGMIGGPVFRLIEEGLTRLEFVGTVYLHGETFELVFARSASVIRADGTLAT